MLNWFASLFQSKDKIRLALGIDCNGKGFVEVVIKPGEEEIFANILFSLFGGELTDDILDNVTQYCVDRNLDITLIMSTLSKKVSKLGEELYLRPSESDS